VVFFLWPVSVGRALTGLDLCSGHGLKMLA
jgi:hypothetical protein